MSESLSTLAKCYCLMIISNIIIILYDIETFLLVLTNEKFVLIFAHSIIVIG